MFSSSIDVRNEPSNEATLVAQVVSGETSAFAPLMRRYNRKLYRTARSIVKDDAEAEDVVQEAYLQAFRSLSKFRAESKLSTWLTRIVVNEALTRLHKLKRQAEIIHLDGDMDHEQPETGSAPDNPQIEPPEHAAIRAETRRLLEKKIDELPETFRTVFVLRELEEMAVEEVSAILSIPDATVRTRHFRARSMLRESLSRELDIALGQAFIFDGERCDRIVASVMKRLNAMNNHMS